MQLCGIALIIVMLMVFLYHCKPSKSEKFYNKSFSQSLVDKYRANIKDKRGFTVNDYLLEANLRGVPLKESSGITFR